MLKKITSMFLIVIMILGILSGCKGKDDGKNENNLVEEIILNKEEVTIKVGESVKIKATIMPEKAKDADLEWKSDDKSIATVSDGRITGVSEGSAVVTVTSENGKYAYCRVTVSGYAEGGSDQGGNGGNGEDSGNGENGGNGGNNRNPEFDVLFDVLPGATDFSKVDISNYTLPSTIVKAYKETSGKGFVIEAETEGFGSGMIIIVGISPDGIVYGAECIISNELSGVEKSYGDKFINLDMDGASSVDLIAGSTLTTKAYRNAVVDAIKAAIILGGVDVDIRTEEEKFRDALDAALPDANGKFTKYFKVEDIKGIDTIYVAENGTGYVCLIGSDSTGVFIGVNKNGIAISEASAEHKALAEAAIAVILAYTYTDIDISEYKNSTDSNIKRTFKNVVWVHKTGTGNYIVEIKSSNQYSGDVPIVLCVAISSEGKILDVQTVSHAETNLVGGVQLEDGAYNSNFIGKNETEAGEVDTVAGVTFTTTAYKNAILCCFDVINIIISN